MMRLVPLPAGSRAMTVVLKKTALGHTEDTRPDDLRLYSHGPLHFNTLLWTLVGTAPA